MKKIIFDTDIGCDCDDAGAMAVLHRLCELGEAELLLVTHCGATPYTAGCIDAINTYYGRVVPVGHNLAASQPQGSGSVYAQALTEQFPNRFPPKTYETPEGAPDSIPLIRKALRDAEDNSVTLVATGNMATLARLLTSPADDISPMTGKEMIAKKLERTVVMGGRFYETWPMVIYADNEVGSMAVDWEWNIKGSVPSAQLVCREWTGELIFASYEIGNYLRTLTDITDRAASENPVRRAYELHSQLTGQRGRPSWDLVAVLDAVRPNTYWYYHEFGRVVVDDGGVTHWRSEKGAKQTYLLPKVDYDEVLRTLNALALPVEE